MYDRRRPPSDPNQRIAYYGFVCEPAARRRRSGTGEAASGEPTHEGCAGWWQQTEFDSTSVDGMICACSCHLEVGYRAWEAWLRARAIPPDAPE